MHYQIGEKHFVLPLIQLALMALEQLPCLQFSQLCLLWACFYFGRHLLLSKSISGFAVIKSELSKGGHSSI